MTEKLETPGFSESNDGLAVMVDLETLGLSPRAAILSIGCVEFDPFSDWVGREFYVVVTRESNDWARREINAQTLKWWEGQPEKAREIFGDPNAMTLNVALTRLLSWYPVGAKVYGNGSDFDVSKLDDAYAQFGVKAPWEFHAVRCYRTVKGLPGADLAPKPARVDHHNALADARYQAVHMQYVYRELGFRT